MSMPSLPHPSDPFEDEVEQDREPVNVGNYVVEFRDFEDMTWSGGFLVTDRDVDEVAWFLSQEDAIEFVNTKLAK